MQLFEAMWDTVRDHVTNIVFKIEQLDESFVGSTWVESEAIHEEAAPATTEIGRQQQAAIAGTEADKKLEPIRNREKRIGRNDPCPCGSGKKYKQCCLRKGG
ncbi:MAG: SEC-C domain-containing protein [Pirellulales bacterium]|nr:SEC-C domain-containing protein [Pirellulales bacterium]